MLQWSSRCSRMKAVATALPGVRVLRQEPWECLASFIFSANNNIARITKGLQSLRQQVCSRVVVSCFLHCHPGFIEFVAGCSTRFCVACVCTNDWVVALHYCCREVWALYLQRLFGARPSGECRARRRGIAASCVGGGDVSQQLLCLLPSRLNSSCVAPDQHTPEHLRQPRQLNSL